MRINTQFARGKSRTKRRSKARRRLFPALSRAMTRQINGVSRIPRLITKTKRVKLKWCQMVTFTNANADQVRIHQFRANGPVDPNTVVDGAQVSPHGYTEYSQFYNKHKCLGSTIKFTQIQMGETADNESTRYYIDLQLIGPENEDVGNPLEHLENLILKNRLSMRNVKQRQGAQDKGGPNVFRPIVLQRSWKLKKADTRDYAKGILDIPVLAVPVIATHPTFSFFLVMDNLDTYSTTRPVDTGNAQIGQNITFMIEMEYDILFTEPKRQLGADYAPEAVDPN